MSTDTLQTVLGIAKGVLIAIVDYVMHAVAMPDFHLWSPTFLLGIAYAVVEAVKGYFAAGVKKPVA